MIYTNMTISIYWILLDTLRQSGPAMRKIPNILWQNVDVLENKTSWNALQTDMAPSPRTSLLHFFSYPCLVKLSIHQASSNNTMVKWQKNEKTCFSFILKVCEAIWPAICTHVNCARTLHSRRTRGVENDARGTVADLFHGSAPPIDTYAEIHQAREWGWPSAKVRRGENTHWNPASLDNSMDWCSFERKLFWPSNVLFPKSIA